MKSKDITLYPLISFKRGLKSPLFYNHTWQPYLSFPCAIWSCFKNICCTSYSPLFEGNAYTNLNSLTAFSFSFLFEFFCPDSYICNNFQHESEFKTKLNARLLALSKKYFKSYKWPYWLSIKDRSCLVSKQ